MQDKQEIRQQLRPKKVAEILGISKTTLWSWIRQGKFPRGRKLSKTITVFYADDVAQWQQSREKTEG